MIPSGALYIIKLSDFSSVGEDDIIYSLLPETMEPVDSCLISEETVKAPPVAE